MLTRGARPRRGPRAGTAGFPVSRRALRCALLAAVLASCATESPDAPGSEPAQDGAPATDTGEVRRQEQGGAAGDTAPTLERFAQDLLAAEEVSLEGLRRAFGEPDRVEREPTPNRHVPGQIDTTLIVHYEEARFRLYQVTDGRTLIERAEVGDPRFLRWPQPTIGTPVDSVVAWWGEPLRTDGSRLVYEDGGPTSTPLILHTSDGRITRIEREYYVD